MQDWIVEIIETLGTAGVAMLMFLENVFPPLPSEVIMPLAGFLWSEDRMPLAGAIVGGSLGSLSGTTFWYFIGRAVGGSRLEAWIDRHGAWLAMEPGDLERARDFFLRHGRSSVFLARFFPLVRTLISVPAGYARMPLGQFLLYSTPGTVIWVALLFTAGALLGAHVPEIEHWMGVFSWAIIVLAVIWYFVRVYQIHRRRRRT